VGNEVVNFSLENFKRQGFLGATFQPWPKRKNPTKWGTKVKNNNRALFVNTTQSDPSPPMQCDPLEKNAKVLSI
jgi:hypothetical protein